MDLKDDLLKYQDIFLDSAPIIYLVEQHGTYLPLMKEVVHLIRTNRLKIFTSPVTLLECLVQPIRGGNRTIEQRFREVIVSGRNINFIPTTSEIGEIAARLRVKYNLSSTDAIQVATAMEANCGALLTNDKILARVTEMPILVLETYVTS